MWELLNNASARKGGKEKKKLGGLWRPSLVAESIDQS